MSPGCFAGDIEYSEYIYLSKNVKGACINGCFEKNTRIGRRCGASVVMVPVIMRWRV